MSELRNDFVDDPARQCYGKRPFDSKQEARRAYKRAQSRPNSDRTPGEVKPYRCPHCGFYHLGGVRKYKLREKE